MERRLNQDPPGLPGRSDRVEFWMGRRNPLHHRIVVVRHEHRREAARLVP